MGDCHVRFCERLRGETPLCLLGEKQKIPSLFTLEPVNPLIDAFVSQYN